MKKLKAVGGATALAFLLGACGAPEGESGTTTPPAATETPTAPTEPEAPIYDPPAPPPQPEPELDTADPWGGLFTEEELAANYLAAVRAEPSSPGIRALDDTTLLAHGATVCPAVETGATFADFQFPGLDPYLEAPIIAGAAVGTWCPDLLEVAMGEL